MRFDLSCAFLLACALNCAFGVAPANSVPVKVVNHAGAPIEVFWVDTNSLEEHLVRQTAKPLRNSSEANINSYSGHQFVAKFLDDIPGVEAFFTKQPTEETVLITYDPDTNEMNARQVTKFDEIMELIGEASATCNDLKDNAFTECIGGKVLEEVHRLIDTTKEIGRYRDVMSSRLYDYVCADAKPNGTEPVRTMSFEDRKERYSVELMLDTDKAKVWVVRNAISPRECELLQTHGDAAPADEVTDTAGSAAVVFENDGTAVVTSELGQAAQGFKAQKTYKLTGATPYQDPLWALFTKAYRMTNFVSKHRLPVLPSGQEGFGISHFGVGHGVGPSCSGSCDGSPYKIGDRVASALLFCQAAEAGGTLLFPKSDVVIRPSVGMGVFFTYKHANSSETDDGYTQHGLCPVQAGQHTVVSLHLRDGVTKITPPALDAPEEGALAASP